MQVVFVYSCHGHLRSCLVIPPAGLCGKWQDRVGYVVGLRILQALQEAEFGEKMELGLNTEILVMQSYLQIYPVLACRFTNWFTTKHSINELLFTLDIQFVLDNLKKGWVWDNIRDFLACPRTSPLNTVPEGILVRIKNLIFIKNM